MDRALLVVQDLVELILRHSCLFASRAAINSPDDIVWLTFARGIPLVTAASTIIVALPIIVIVAALEAAALLFLFVCPSLHHITKLYHYFRTVSSEIMVKRLCHEALVEVVDDVLIADVGNGCPCVEEALDV